MQKVRHFENVHILLWLLKDICWLMEYRFMGAFMIIPTILVALLIVLISIREKDDEAYINGAILLWIIANAYWMICEFVERDEMKNWAAVPFVLGLILVSIFYTKRISRGERII
ncbi:MAG: hypothetical protein DWQ44_00580 [Bacteroidetes bacterium]|nr:MAG: hypothetical protein DWQ33_03955 [Bacteroidota bacterium]REK07560.1 MAG: hypothetical protein DWQ39_01315 [Bacteroidota bacterium]REK37007.1 MAG: hypothetical protein DWQ44_00580 [Bacteroidota bacterium]REK47828.1 MAG: hypothetical protein DWQ48_11640 [Bacteroidota bacterium]